MGDFSLMWIGSGLRKASIRIRHRSICTSPSRNATIRSLKPAITTAARAQLGAAECFIDLERQLANASVFPVPVCTVTSRTLVHSCAAAQSLCLDRRGQDHTESHSRAEQQAELTAITPGRGRDPKRLLVIYRERDAMPVCDMAGLQPSAGLTSVMAKATSPVFSPRSLW